MIVRLARVPTHDSAFCRRVAGPGLTAPGYCGLSAAQAAAAAAARAELDALQAWTERTEREVERPLADYRHFVDACFGPFSVQIAKVTCAGFETLKHPDLKVKVSRKSPGDINMIRKEDICHYRNGYIRTSRLSICPFRV